MAAENFEKKKKLPNHLRTLHERDQEKRLIVVLERASLETIKVLLHKPDFCAKNKVTKISLKAWCHSQNYLIYD